MRRLAGLIFASLVLFAGCASVAPAARDGDPWLAWRAVFVGEVAAVRARLERCDGPRCACQVVCGLALPALPDHSADLTLSVPGMNPGTWRVDVSVTGRIEECRYLADKAPEVVWCEGPLASFHPRPTL